MPFPTKAYYRIKSKDKTVIVKVIESVPAIHKVRVQDIETKEERYLVDYLLEDGVEIVRVMNPNNKK